MIKLEDIKSPEFLKQLSTEELEQLAEQIRNFIIKNVSETGGHLSSNLGTVELIIALHYVFSSPKDKIIFDVGHQAYTHKILTGRAREFSKLRKKGGLSGFLKYNESIHDVWEAGHSSTSISAAAGFLTAKEMGSDIGEVIGVIGDGAIQNGLAFSALNYLGSVKKQKVIIILNDNDMSISRNVGSLSKIFNRIRIKRSYNLLKKITPRFIHKTFYYLKEALKTYVYRNNPLAALGYRYFGPINGHQIKTLIDYLKYAKKAEQSIIIHVKTVKGKGYPFSETDQVGVWHGIGPFDITTGKSLKTLAENEISWSEGIGRILLDFAQVNPKIMVISAAMIYGAGLEAFAAKLPRQIKDVGIAEEHGVVMAAALARCGMIPIVSIYSTFLQRAYDEINHDVTRTNSHVVLLIDRAGIVGADGDTHQGTFDLAYLSHLPNITIMMPKDLNEAANQIDYAINRQFGPIAIRYPKGDTPKLTSYKPTPDILLWEEVLPIKERNIITYGPDVLLYREAITGGNLDFGLINARTVKPLDEVMLRRLAGKTIIIVEEVVIKGSLAAMILEADFRLALNMTIKIHGIDDHYVDFGSIDEIKKELGLDVITILNNYRDG
ncbi:MAG: 1-deoxy-D-xylulose-5-phosphate synthase [Bacilli bacterium]|nr:1-deoxy-D-xylulose-5-phosphate synthase [Bacilli bacterium]